MDICLVGNNNSRTFKEKIRGRFFFLFLGGGEPLSLKILEVTEVWVFKIHRELQIQIAD